MKNRNIYFIFILFSVLTLVFSGCSMITGIPEEENVLRLYINSFPNTARTISPDFSTSPDFQKYFIMIYGQGSTTTNYNLTFTGSDRHTPKLTNVAYGTYNITVWGYLNAGDGIGVYSAEGVTDFTFDSENTTASVTLSPIDNNGTGTLRFKLTDSTGTFTSADLINYSDIDIYPDIIDPEPGYPCVLDANTGVFDTITLPSGYYALYFGENAPETVLIFRNFETVVDLAISTPPKVSAPAASPAGSPLIGSTSVALSCATVGASIYYTVNGDTPTLWSEVYSGPITVTANPTTIKAFAVKPDMLDSDVMVETFTLKTAAPTASPVAGAVALNTPVTLSCATVGAAVYYTVDGSEPTTSDALYSSPIAVSGAVTIKAIAVLGGRDNSDVLTAAYTLIQRTVTFDENYSGGGVSGVTVPDGSTVGGNLLTPAAREAFAFTGWNTQQNGGGSAFDGSTFVTGDITVYAQWDPRILLAAGSDVGLVAGNGTITGLASGKYYKVIEGGSAFYVKADGTLSANLKDIGIPAGVAINGLTNGTSYKVNAAAPFEVVPFGTGPLDVFDHPDGALPVTPQSANVAGGILALGAGGDTLWGINLDLNPGDTYEIMKLDISPGGESLAAWSDSKCSGVYQHPEDCFEPDISGKEVGIYQYISGGEPSWINGMSIIYAPTYTSTTDFLIVDEGGALTVLRVAVP